MTPARGRAEAQQRISFCRLGKNAPKVKNFKAARGAGPKGRKEGLLFCEQKSLAGREAKKTSLLKALACARHSPQ